MGAYLYYKLKDGLSPEKVNEDIINTFGAVPGIIHFWDKEDIRIEEEKEFGNPDIWDYAEGNFKVSYYLAEEMDGFIKSVKYVREKYGKDSIIFNPHKSDSMFDRDEWILKLINDTDFVCEQHKMLKEGEEDSEYIESCLRYKDKTLEETGCIFVADSYADSKICMFYGNIYMPEWYSPQIDRTKLHNQDITLPMERTKDGAAIMLIPLQTLDGRFPQKDGKINTVYDVVEKMLMMGVLEHPYRLMALLYKRSTGLMYLKELYQNPPEGEFKYMTLDKIDHDIELIKKFWVTDETGWKKIEGEAYRLFKNINRYKKDRVLDRRVAYLVFLYIAEGILKKQERVGK